MTRTCARMVAAGRWLTLAVLAGAACGVGATTPEEAQQQLDRHFAECTRRHGYDPKGTDSLGPHELGANEREWRSCAYQGVESIMIPASGTPDVYRRIIAEDREMTDKVADGQMTRAQRKARLDELIGSIGKDQPTPTPQQRMQLRTIQNIQRTMGRL